MDLALHSETSTLEGTVYFEFVPGPYQRKHWVPGARFLHKDAFRLMEPAFVRHASAFNHYGCADVPKSEWRPILEELRALEAGLLDAGVEQPFDEEVTQLWVYKEFQSLGRDGRERLGESVRQLTAWLELTLEQHEFVCVLGL